MVKVKVRFQGAVLVVGGVEKVCELQAALEKETRVRVGDQKLVWKGQKLGEDVDLHEDQLFQLIGTPAEEISGLEHEIEKRLQDTEVKNVRNDMDADYEEIERMRKVRAEEKELEDRKRDAALKPYKFNGTRVLENFRDKDKARKILDRLASDPGFVAVLQKHKWNIGVLSEMYPDGKVGVDPVCVLGVNINKGQEISLRLRTDDLQGFRKFAEIKKVLCHELSHMVWSEHDSNFYQLMRQIESEIVQLDWRNSKGNQLGGREFLNSSVIAPSGTSKGSISGGAFKLGGSECSCSEHDDPRELAAKAAENRVHTQNHDKNETAPEKGEHTHEEDVVMEEEKADEKQNEQEQEQEQQQQQQQQMSPDTTDEKQIKEQQVSQEPEVEWVEPTEEEKGEIQDAIGKIIERNSIEIGVKALELLLKITKNVVKSPGNEKYRQLRLENKKLKQVFDGALGSRNVLNTIGWALLDDGVLSLPSDPLILGKCIFAQSQMEESLLLVSSLVMTD